MFGVVHITMLYSCPPAALLPAGAVVPCILSYPIRLSLIGDIFKRRILLLSLPDADAVRFADCVGVSFTPFTSAPFLLVSSVRRPSRDRRWMLAALT